MSEENKEKQNFEVGNDGTITDDQIAALDSVAQELGEERQEYKKERAQRLIAKKEDLFKKKEKIFDLEMPIDNDTVYIFKVKRMTEAERIQYSSLINLQYNNISEMKKEDLEQLSKDSYQLLEALVIEPKLTAREWREMVDVALSGKIAEKLALLSTEVNDAVLVEKFQVGY